MGYFILPRLHEPTEVYAGAYPVVGRLRSGGSTCVAGKPRGVDRRGLRTAGEAGRCGPRSAGEAELAPLRSAASAAARVAWSAVVSAARVRWHAAAARALVPWSTAVAVSLLAALALSACSLSGGYEADTPAHLNDIQTKDFAGLNSSITSYEFSPAGSEPLPARWWTALGDPALDDLIEEALGANFSLRAARDRLAQARAVARREGADLFPNLDAGVSAARTRSRTAGRSSSSSSYGAGLAASYELDLWGRVRALRDAAQLDAEAGADDVAAAAISLSATVALSWYELAEALEQESLLERQIATNEKVLELVTERFRRGQSQAADVLRQRQLVEATRGNLEIERARSATLANRLSVLIGRTPGGRLPLEDAALRDPPLLPASGIPASLISSRPDLRSAYSALLAADRRVAAAVADRLPRLSLAASADTTGGKVNALFDDWIGNLAANLSAPLIDGGRRRAEVDRTRAAASEALSHYGDIVLTSLREVEDALVGEERQVALLRSLGEQLDIAQHVIERTRDSYINGQLDYLRVLDALTSRQTLERQYLAARRERLGFRIELSRALAAPWPGAVDSDGGDDSLASAAERATEDSLQ